jgi:deoxyadenosine/deoxycytidine kinase
MTMLDASTWRSNSRSSCWTTITDYSPAKDVLFARDMLLGEDLDLWTRTYEHVYRDFAQPEVVIYLRVSAEECLRRVAGRGREFEANMTLERLQRMEALYEGHLDALGTEVITLDVHPGQDAETVADAVVAVVGNAAVKT